MRTPTLHVSGVVTDEGACAERLDGDVWTMRMRLAPWSRRDCMATDEPLHLTRLVTTDELIALQHVLLAGVVVDAVVRIEPGTLHGEIVRVTSVRRVHVAAGDGGLTVATAGDSRRAVPLPVEATATDDMPT
ncbi:hypothetical protein ACVWZN_001831 [Lysobacter sp. HA35]